MTAPLDIGGNAAALLAAVVGRAPFHLWTPPSRQYITVGPPVYDCEALVVTTLTTVPGLPGIPSAERYYETTTFSLSLVVHVVRKWPTSHGHVSISTEKLTEAAQDIMADGSGLLRVMADIFAAGDLGSCRAIAPGTLQYLGPEGGYVGTALPIQVQL